MIEPTCKLFTKWKQEGNEVEKVRCDNGKENMKLQFSLAIASWKLNPGFDYAARGAPQQNIRVEAGSYTVAKRGIVMMIQENNQHVLRYKL